MPGLMRRLRGRETVEVEGTEPSPLDTVTSSSERPETIEKGEGASTARDIGEAEANQKLYTFERAHRWDPNLDDDQLLEIDDAINARGPNAEGRIYDEVFENSPYPEVCASSEQLSYATVHQSHVGLGSSSCTKL